MNIKKLIKFPIIISVIMLLLSILPLPYGYYTLLRIIVCGTAIYLVWFSYKLSKMVWVWIMGGIAILFNPLIPIHLNKGTWVFIDLIISILFLIFLRLYKNESNTQKKTKPDNTIPDDSIDPKGVYRYMRKKEVNLYQEYLNKIFDVLNIEEKDYGYQWTKEDGDKILEITQEAKEKYNLNFLYFQTMLEQYVDADRMIRQLHKENWVRTVTGYDLPLELQSFEDDFFPDAYSIFSDVVERFCER